MRNLILFLLLFISFSAWSQDLIVTTGGDSLNCKITKVKQGHIYFTFKHNEEIRSTLLPLEGVLNHQFDFFEEREVPEKCVIYTDNYQKVRMALNGGYSYRTAGIANSVPSDLRDHTRALKSGYHLGGDISWFFAEQLGVGLNSSLFKASNSTPAYIDVGNGSFSGITTLNEEVTILFLGPQFTTRFLNEDKTNAFIMSSSLGYIGYVDDAVLGEEFKLKGSSLGYVFQLGYDLGLSDKLSLGLQVSLLAGTLTKIKKEQGAYSETIKLDEGSYESLSRIDFSVGFRFHK